MATKYAATNLRGYTSTRVFNGVRTLEGSAAKSAVSRALVMKQKVKDRTGGKG